MDLTFPSEGSSTLRALMPRVLTRLVQQYVALPDGDSASVRAIAHTAARAMMSRDAGALASALALPTQSALLGAVIHDGVAASRRRLEHLDLLVLAELAVTSDALDRVRVAKPAWGWPPLLSITAGWRIDLDDAVKSVTFAAHSIRIEFGAGENDYLEFDPRVAPMRDAGAVRIAAGFVPIVGNVKLALADVNPLASVQLHPERAGNAIDFGGRSLDEWLGPLREAFALIERYLHPVFDEMQMLLRTVVPVGYLPERHASCSYEDALGSIYLTLHPSPLKMAEALVHEFQHNKLHALMRLDAVLTNARTSRHRSPVRPDPRPLEGVLLAVHAFIPVAMMYRAMTEAGDPLAKSRDWGATCEAAERVYRDGAETLYAHGEPTKTGRALLDEMRGLMERIDRGNSRS